MKAAIIGATGLVGQQLLAQLLESGTYSEVHAIGRREIAFSHPCLVQHVISLDALGKLQLGTDIDHAYCTLGTTIKQARSPHAFQRVDRDYVCVFGKLMKQAGASCMGVNSSIGANTNTRNLYLRTKGEMEQCLRDLQFEKLVIVRPSLLVPTGRRELRLGEIIAYNLFRILGWSLVGPLHRYRPVTPGRVAQTLYRKAQGPGTGVMLVESDAINTG